MAHSIKTAGFCTIVSFLMLISSSASAQESDIDYGVWAMYGVNVSPVKGLKITAGGELGTIDCSSKVEEIWGECLVDYKFCKYVSANTGYIFIYKNLISTPCHRWFIGATGHLPVGITKFDLRERYQETYTVGKSEPDRRLRNRLQFTVNIPNSMFSPFAHVEPHVSLNGSSLWDVVQVRYALGTGINMGRHSISVYWWGFQYPKASAAHSFVNYLAMSYYFTIK